MSKKVKMYGTKDSKFFAPGEETTVDKSMVEYFQERGLSIDKPAEKPEPKVPEQPKK